MYQFENPILFYFRNKTLNEYYYLDGSGVVQTDPDPTDRYLQDEDTNPQAPEGWRETTISWERSKMYWGLFRNMSTEFTFIGQAAEILTYLLFTEGTTAECELIIKQRDMANVGTTVSLNTIYIGDLDFLKCEPSHGKFKVAVKESGLRDLFTQNEKVTYEIELDGPNAIDLALFGMKLLAKKRYVTAASGFNYTPRTLVTPPISFSADDGNIVLGQDQYVDWGDSTAFTTGTPTPTSNQWFFRSFFTQTVDIDYDLNFGINYSNSNTGFQADIVLSFVVFADGNMTSVVSTNHIWTQLNVSPGTNFPISNVAGTITQNLNQGNVISLRVFVNNNNTIPITTGNTIAWGDGWVNIKSDLNLPLTTCKGKQEKYVFEEVIYKMSGGLYLGDSSFWAAPPSSVPYVDSYPYLTVYSSGDAIRQLSNTTGQPDKLKLTPGEFFDNIMKDWGGAIWIENNEVKFGLKSEVLNPSVQIADIGEVSDFSAPPADDLLCNVIEAGCDEQEYDGLNGKDEFMNRSKWKTALCNPQVLDLVRRYRYDVYGIELTRYRLLDQNTTDNEADNDIFVWEFDNTTLINGAYPAYRPQNDVGNSASGVLFPDGKYNFPKSPARVPNRNADYVQGMLYYQGSSSITFQSTEKNRELTSDLGFGTIDEDANITASTLGGASPLFIPNYLKFKWKGSRSLIDAVNTTPNGYIKFSVRGVELKGFPMSIDLNLSKDMEQDVILLCHPDVDPLDIREAVKRSQIFV